MYQTEDTENEENSCKEAFAASFKDIGPLLTVDLNPVDPQKIDRAYAQKLSKRKQKDDSDLKQKQKATEDEEKQVSWCCFCQKS